MNVPRKQAAFLREAIEQWKHDGLLADAQAAQLAGSNVVQPFDWRRLAKYSFWIALFSIVSSVSAALSDQFLMDLLEQLFDAPAAGAAVKKKEVSSPSTCANTAPQRAQARHMNRRRTRVQSLMSSMIRSKASTRGSGAPQSMAKDLP